MSPKNSNKENNDGEMLLSYCDLLLFLFIININLSLLHLHLLDEKNAFLLQKSPRNFIHLVAILAIVAYLIFTYKRISKKNGARGEKTTLIVITAILITGNVLLLVKSLTPFSLTYLPLVMIGCFLIALIIFRVQQYFKPHDQRQFFENWDINMDSSTAKVSTTFRLMRENCFIITSEDIEKEKEAEKTAHENSSNDKKKTYHNGLYEHINSNRIESIQIIIGLLGLAAISFELIYDNVLTNTTIKAFKLEAPQLVHHVCITLQILTALFIVGCFIAKKITCIHFPRKKNRTNSNIRNHDIIDNEISTKNEKKTLARVPDFDNALCGDTFVIVSRKPSCWNLHAAKNFIESINHYTDDNCDLSYI